MFMQYPFFRELYSIHGEELYLGVMRYIKFMAAPKNIHLIEEGDDGDRFYVIINGRVGVLKSYTTEVPNFEVK
jgi:CRP-like cAMP-binding protein